MAELIKGVFYVNSKSGDKAHLVTKDLVCDCKAYYYHKKCSHVKEVIKELEKGKFVKNSSLLKAREYSYQGQRF